MTLADRVESVATYGFTPRQAAFLTTVMLHAGVCVARQYTAFAHIVFGQNTRDFLRRLTDERFATAHACWRGGGRIYHVHHKGLYRAIGEPNNRHRRPVTLTRALERLMALDVVLAAPELTWLGAEREKVSHFLDHRQLSVDDLPALLFRQGAARTVRHFPAKLPIGLGAGEAVVFVYVVTDPTGREFRAFLDAHRRLLQRLPRWTIRVALATASPEIQRRALEDGTLNPLEFDAARFAAARRAFGAQRFYDAYRAWRTSGDRVIHDLLSPRLHEAWTRGDGRVELHVLPHQYQRLAAAIATA